MENKNTLDDPCVICGDRTGVIKTEKIENRVGYVEGAGQLCFSCMKKYI